EDRGAAVIRIKNKGILLSKKGFSKDQMYDYLLHQQFLIKQGKKLYQEERMEKRFAKMSEGDLVLDCSVEVEGEPPQTIESEGDDRVRMKGSYYDRLSALKYAER
ncbi:hypothetical protein R0J91_14295, partial [Micrococcus sp. SIMBA_131]